jgi:pilus assembly protein TadC
MKDMKKIKKEKKKEAKKENKKEKAEKIEVGSVPASVKFKKFMKENKKTVFTGIILSLIASSAAMFFYKNIIISVATFIAAFAIVLIYDYLRKVLKKSSKIKKTEGVFPDFLQLMASNLRAGMTVDRAILLSSRPEFDPLDKEIMIVGKDIATGKTLENSLSDMAKRIGSEKIEKTVFLIISGIKSGGNLSILLEETSRNMRQRGFVEKRAASNVLMYVIFIFIAASVGAPVLFSLSTLLVQTLINTISSMQALDPTSVSSLPFSFSSVNISVDFIKYFSIVFIITTDILASLVLGLVGKGEEREGVKYIIPMVLISLAIFFILRILLSGFVIDLMG